MSTIRFHALYIFVLLLTLNQLGCSDQNAAKQEFIAIYNEAVQKSPPALGEGVYPLTANFGGEDKGKDGLAQALVDVGLLKPDIKDSSAKPPGSFANSIVTFHLTELGKKAYDDNVRGFAWGRHSAISATNIKTVNANGQKTAYVALKTKIIDIPDWAKQPAILAGYPVVKETLDKNEFRFNAVYKSTNNKWVLTEVNRDASAK
jgi:hypothetical protein